MTKHCFTTEVYYNLKNKATTLEIPEELVKRLGLDYGEELSLIEENGKLIISKLVDMPIDLSPKQLREISTLAAGSGMSLEEYITEVLNLFTTNL